MSELIAIYDTTLRDGMQREGLSLSVGEQLDVALRLADYGIDYLEAGFPASNPKYGELFRRLESEDLGATRLAAFGMTRRRGVGAPPRTRPCAASPSAPRRWPRSSARPGTSTSRRSRASRARRTCAMIEESVAFLVGRGQGGRLRRRALLRRLRRPPGLRARLPQGGAEAGGAAWITPCDTNGATLPARFAAACARSRAALPGAALGIHTHNDAECAVANSLAAVDEGARMVQGTINGYGERCGNANLVSIIPSLTLKMGYRTLDPGRLAELTALSRFVAETANLQPDSWAPVRRPERLRPQGRHAPAGRATPTCAPTSTSTRRPVGNERRVLVSELSGRGTILAKARELGVDLGDVERRVPAILGRLKELEHRGYHFEVADGSFELLLERETGVYEPLFTLESFRVITEKRADGRVETEATVKVFHRGERLVATAEGNGPVNALDGAAAQRARAARARAGRRSRWSTSRCGSSTRPRAAARSPGCSSTRATAATTWGAIGVSENIIEASWEALLDSLEHGVRRAARAPAPAAPAG